MADIQKEAQQLRQQHMENINADRPRPDLTVEYTPEGSVTTELYTEEYHRQNAETDKRLQAYVDGLDKLEISASDEFNLAASNGQS